MCSWNVLRLSVTVQSHEGCVQGMHEPVCSLEEGQTGMCRARKNTGGAVIPVNYGKITSMALDPIEKKPLRRFCPGLCYIVGWEALDATCGAPSARIMRYPWRERGILSP